MPKVGVLLDCGSCYYEEKQLSKDKDKDKKEEKEDNDDDDDDDDDDDEKKEVRDQGTTTCFHVLYNLFDAFPTKF